MIRFIRQLVQKLIKEQKDETRLPSSHNNGKPNVVGCQNITYTVLGIDKYAKPLNYKAGVLKSRLIPFSLDDTSRSDLKEG